MTWTPHKGAQEVFLARSEFEVLFGGAAGPGKTDCLVAALSADIDHPKYTGLILRRTFPQLQEIIDRCHTHYPSLGGVYRAGDKRWTFPSGSHINLGHMQHEADKYNYQGKEYVRVGFDELTQFTETQYTYLHSRTRTTDPSLIPQVLSTTNPGGIGHYWVKERFQPEHRALKPYVDPKTGLTRMFVPGTIEDNPSLYENDPVYLARLENLPEIERKRLRYGIWDAFEGQVFTELSMNVHGIEPFSVPPEWPRYCVLDWGYAKPFSVGWYAVDYDGVLYRYREWYGCKKEAEGLDGSEGADEGLRMQAWEVAKGILEREAGEKIKQRIADPAIWHKRPDYRRKEARGVTIRDDFSNEGVHFTKADNDRAQGKLQVHKRLQMDQVIDGETGEITEENPRCYIFKDHKGFWRTLPNMAENPKNPEDVDDDHTEDHCVVGETVVITPQGLRLIRDMVGEEGHVLTVGGQWTRFWHCRRTRTGIGVIRLRFEDDSTLVCTPDHRILLATGEWRNAEDFLDEFGYNTWPCESGSSATPSRNLTGFGTTYVGPISNERESGFTGRFGSTTTGPFQMAHQSITPTTIDSITRSKTSKICPILNTLRTTAESEIVLSGNPLCARVPVAGMAAMKAVNGTANTSRSTSDPGSRNVRTQSAPRVEDRSNALRLAARRSIAAGSAKPVRCVSVEPAGVADVYCLVADDTHAFAVQSGVVISNCYDEFRYMCMARPITPKKVTQIPTGTFRHEREKLIRMKKLAQRRGISLSEAYRRGR